MTRLLLRSAAMLTLVLMVLPVAAFAQETRYIMNATAKDKGSAGRDNTYGYGIVQTKAAVDALGASAFCTTSDVSKY